MDVWSVFGIQRGSLSGLRWSAGSLDLTSPCRPFLSLWSRHLSSLFLCLSKGNVPLLRGTERRNAAIHSRSAWATIMNSSIVLVEATKIVTKLLR